MTAITGNTYPVRAELRAMGGTPRFEDLRREQFHSYDSGKIIAGIKHEILTPAPPYAPGGTLQHETHETYQFDDLADVIACAVAFRDTIPGMKRIRVVTHRGEYKDMKTLCEWRAE